MLLAKKIFLYFIFTIPTHYLFWNMKIQLNGAVKLNLAFKANPMPEKQAEYIDNKFREADSIDIFCHAYTDEDCFNSAKAMFLYFKSIGKQPRIIADNHLDLFGYDESKYNILPMDKVDEDTQCADLALCMDFSREQELKKDNVIRYFHQYNKANVVGLDHHSEKNPISSSRYELRESYLDTSDMPDSKPGNFYSDASSKSSAAVVYRFFEALGVRVSKAQRLSLFAGMCDDMKKSGDVNFFDNKSVVFSSEAMMDFNTCLVYREIAKKISPENRVMILTHLNKTSELSPLEKSFQKSLFENVKITDDGKLAYFEIDLNDPNWAALNGDNPRTRRIVVDARSSLLLNNTPPGLVKDEVRKKLANINAVASVSSDFNTNLFAVVLTTKKDYAKRYEQYVKNSFKAELEEMGIHMKETGHNDRGGWLISNDSEAKCKMFFNFFLEAAKNVE